MAEIDVKEEIDSYLIRFINITLSFFLFKNNRNCIESLSRKIVQQLFS